MFGVEYGDETVFEIYGQTSMVWNQERVAFISQSLSETLVFGDMRDNDDDEFELDSVVGRSSYLILALDSPQALFVGSYPINIMVILMMMVIMTIFMMVMILILLAFLMELIIMMTREGAHSPTLFFSRNAIDREQLEWLDPANKFVAIPITTIISKSITEYREYILYSTLQHT